MSALISRKAAIDALAEMYCKSDEDGYVWIIRSDAWKRIDALPSAQPIDESDLIELRDRYGDEVRFVVEDMLSGEGKRWTI